MSFSSRPTLTPEDLIASRTLFSKIFQGLFHFTSINFYFPDSPQSALNWREGGNFEEFAGLNGDASQTRLYDQERKRLFIPLSLQGRSLGFLVFFGLSPEPDAETHHWLERLCGLALEMAALKKQAEVDPLTGLYQEWAFRKKVIRFLSQWTRKGRREDKKPERLSLAENQSEETLILGVFSLRPQPARAVIYSPLAERDWRNWIRNLRQTFPPETIWATVDHHPLTLGFFCSSEKDNRKGFFSSTALKAFAGDHECLVHLGWTVLDPHRQETSQGNPSAFSLLTRCWEQAGTALGLARAMGESTSLGYHEILEQAGRVTELLPGHRLVINIGQKAGVTPAMRFSLLEEGEGRQEKGFIIPLDIQEELSIAEVIYLRETGIPVQKNDAVRLVSADAGNRQEPEIEFPPPQGPLRSFQMFQQKLREALKSTDAFALAIGRLDDYADRIKLWGKESLLEMQKEMNRQIEERLPAGGLNGPYGRDGFILFIPGLDQPKVWAWLLDLKQQIQRTLNLSLSFALAHYPCPPFHKGEVLDNTIKALDHLSFLGAGSMVVFDAVSLNISGDRLYNLGDLKGAMAEYEKALILDPGNINVLNSLGVCFAIEGHLDRAIEMFLQILGLSPEDFMASFNLGFATLRLGMAEKALAIWEELARKNTPPFELAYHLGRMYRDQKDFVRAFGWFKKAEEAPDRKGFIYRLLGEGQEALGKRKEAMSYFKKALKINPQDAHSLSHLGALYLQQGESLKVALSLCQQAARLEPSKGLFWVNLGKALWINQAPQKTVEALHQALSRGEHSKEVYTLLGLAFQSLGNFKESQNYFIEALKRDPEDTEIQGYLKALERILERSGGVSIPGF